MENAIKRAIGVAKGRVQGGGDVEVRGPWRWGK